MTDNETHTVAMTLGSAEGFWAPPLREFAARRNRTLPHDATAFVTTTARRQRRLLRSARQREMTVVAVLSPTDLVIAIHQDEDAPSHLTARLEDLDTSSRLHELAQQRGIAVPHGGLTLTGFAVNGTEGGSSRGSYHLSLGSPDGPRARQTIVDAITAARAR